MTARRSSGSSLVDSAVEPTRSQNITVSCRLSASEVVAETAAGMSEGCSERRGAAPPRSAAIAFSSLRRGPRG